ncbi:DUF4255 domain-containing protein [Chitinimonas taiwanensis]|uniref:Pvc16 N-terminal domain-containing protein n=1 Tax=Chitinimonas taiwanensis DSM 18899 TaxID=1121279 RepID=A0A1K2HS02_9NEIS|nr:DUF4255 domain-containing protein [Chitinimonas taiwanensis]SFZ79526.1 Protein of unknown function [Chitinimonas taiwanensis DSM 18899]
MIDSAIGHLTSQLNQHLRRRFALAEDMAVATNLQEIGGAAVSSASNKLVLFISGIERDTAAHRARGAGSGEYTSQLRGSEPLFLNLLMVCAATFSGQSYPEALKFLSDAIAFFQTRPVFDHQNSPELDARIERLVLNIENLSTSEMHSLWSMHGGRYLPSVLYRIRLVCLDNGMISRREPLVHAPDVGLQRQ